MTPVFRQAMKAQGKMKQQARLIYALLVLLSGCTEINQAKAYLMPPTALGMEEIAPGIFVNKAMCFAKREELPRIVINARNKITDIYGSTTCQPKILACSTEECFAGLGGGKSLAKDLGKSKILVSSKGLTVPILAHELSHAELRTRTDARMDGVFGIPSIPTWFDEGLAVIVSEEPAHSERVWEEIVAAKMATPNLESLVSLKGWNKAARQFGDVENSMGVSEKICVVYATAGHEVRKWYQRVGRGGLLSFIDKIKSGESFERAFKNN